MDYLVEILVNDFGFMTVSVWLSNLNKEPFLFTLVDLAYFQMISLNGIPNYVFLIYVFVNALILKTVRNGINYSAIPVS